MHEFRIDGPALKKGVPIHLCVSGLDRFQSVIDKSYLVLSKSQRMSTKDREIFYLRAVSFRQSSFITDFEIILAGIQITLPFLNTLGPQNLWNFTKDAFSFLKLICNAVRNGEKPTYEFKNQGDVIVQVGDHYHHYHSQVINIGKMALPSYQSLAHLIQPSKVDTISSRPHQQECPDIYIGPNDKEMFDIPKRLEKETVNLGCEIFDFNKYKNKGKLYVKEPGQAVETGEYNFEVYGSQDNVEYIYSMLKKEVELFCLIEMESNPFGDDTVHKLHVTGVNI